MVSGFSATVNNFALPENSIQIDDFSPDKRLVHIIINQLDLKNLSEKQSARENKMLFSITPSDESWAIGTVTSNGQFRVNLDWKPHKIESGDKVTFYFDVLKVVHF